MNTHFLILSKNLLCLLLITSQILVTGCGNKNKSTGNTVSWSQCLLELTDLSKLPLLNDPNIEMITSYDRSGGNNDFNNFAGRSEESGWVVLAEREGPGCIRRFWMTGTDPDHPIRIFIDGEKKARIDTTLDALFGKVTPWLTPIAQYVNMCYYSYVPITFAKSVRIETKEPNVHPYWGPRRIFFQLAVEHFPDGTDVESYPKKFSQEQIVVVSNVVAAWNKAINVAEWKTLQDVPVHTLAPTERNVIWEQTGPGTVTQWDISVMPSEPESWSQINREYLLQDTVLRVFYNASQQASIEVPLGDFFANAWRKRTYGSLWFTSTDEGYTCRLPMPFSQSIRFEIENGADQNIAVTFRAITETERSESSGYLHAEYRRSGPGGGKPHVITSLRGRGKFMGCFLGVTGLDQSWWILEGDERMWVDGNNQPVWHGTGLEDYFNGGWYYRGSVFGALNANFDRAPFRVAQFRHQHPDPVSFSNFFQMEFERMNDERTGQPVNGYFQSVAYAYLETPTGVTPMANDRNQRRAVESPLDRGTFLLQLVELERGNDFTGAIRFIQEYMERYPDSEELGVYRLRHLEYQRLLGHPVSTEDYDQFLSGKQGEEAKKQAELLTWFYEHPNRAIIGMNVNGRGRLQLNGEPILAGDHPYHLFVAGRELSDGIQQLAAHVEMQRAEPWLQVGIRTHQGVTGTGPGTLAARTVTADWAREKADSADWLPIGLRDIPRGVPDAPYVGGIANAFILLQSKSYPVRGLDWSYFQGSYYYRQDFELPLKGWPSYSTIMTGLQK